jgi:trimeric autotransporter adhesin
MALILKDRVKETTTVTSTGTATLLGASTGYQSFSVIGTGNTCYYTIAAQTTNEWEVGLGTYTSPDQLSRDTVLSSSNSGSLVNFSAGTKDVFISQPAEEAVYVSNATGKVEAFGNGANTISFTNINTTNLTANTVTLTAGTISTNAANATDIVNKQYVDGIVAAGVHYHAPVLVESPTALIATYNQPGGAGNGVGATLTNSGANVALVIDGVTLSNTARVLVYTQSNAVQNGVYTVTNPGNVSAQWVLTRATDADTYVIDSPTGLSEGSTFFVQSGNTGAGETYTCNTTGLITFGTTNINFAQISSAQIYSAGTGLSLTNTTFSISNTAVTAAQYGNDGAVGQFTVNAQGQITNAANVSINASSITVGTLANGRTTAASANGASTIVLRDSNGDFTANTITATTSNATTFNGTTGSFTNVSGNGVALTAINASNITSGTIANARTTASDANSASTIVARDANGSFGANVITATFSGNGASISAINASNISSGTIANARTTASSSNGASTIVQRDSGGSFDANLVNAVSLSGNAATVTGINASNIASGTIANARTTASSSNGASTIVLRGASGEFAAGAITGASFSGDGSAITAINATAITTGTIANARTTATSANGASTIVVRDANGSFAGNVGTFVSVSGAHSGNGAGLSDINASNISTGTISNARTTAASANGASTIVARGTSGEFTAGAITASSFSGSGSGLTSIPNSATTAASANGASTIVSRDASGNFNANTITASLSGTATTGTNWGAYGAVPAVGASFATANTIGRSDANGYVYTGYINSNTANNENPTVSQIIVTNAADNFYRKSSIASLSGQLTGINASNLSSGTVATARLASGTANASTYLRGDQTWATISAGVTITNDTSTNASYYPVFTTATSGTISAANVSSTELIFNPGLNTLTAPILSASSGFVINNLTIATSYSIPSGYSASSVGPVSISSGVVITVPSGSRWVVL